jgi:hypothetical protein
MNTSTAFLCYKMTINNAAEVYQNSTYEPGTWLLRVSTGMGRLFIVFIHWLQWARSVKIHITAIVVNMSVNDHKSLCELHLDE